MFSKVVVPFHIPPAEYESSSGSTPSPTLDVIGLPNFSCSNEYSFVSSYFPSGYDAEHLHVLVCCLCVFFGEGPVHICCLLGRLCFYWVVVLCFRYTPLPRYTLCKYFLPICGVSVSYSIFWKKVLNFD